MELAVDDGKNQKNQNGDDCNCNQPIRSHPKPRLANQFMQAPSMAKGSLPTGHSPQRFNTSINITLTLLQPRPRVLNHLPLLIQIGQRIPPNIFRLQREPLTVLQPRRTALQPLRPTQQLLPLLQMFILRVIRVPIPKQCLAIIRQRLELTLRLVKLGGVVAEPHVDL